MNGSLPATPQQPLNRHTPNYDVASFGSGNIRNGTTIPATIFSQTHSAGPGQKQHPSTQADEAGSDAKRRRISRACDMCRKKKIKCDGKLPACTHCVNYKTECVFTLVEKKRNPPKGAKYIEGLENRLGRMETLLKLSGLLPEGDDNADLGDLERRLQESSQRSRATSNIGRSSSESTHETPGSSTQSTSDSPNLSRQQDGEVEALSDQMCSLVTSNGEVRFIGSSSGFSIFSPQGIQWVNEKTGDTSFLKMMHEATHEQKAKPLMPCGSDIFGEIFERRGTDPLPPKKRAVLLVQDFFRDFNVLFPLFHKPSFEDLLERQYSDNPPADSGWYAAFNIVLALACKLRIAHTTPLPKGDDGTPKHHIREAWGYFRNAGGVLTELFMRNTDLLSIQAILAMALFMHGTANPQSSFFLIAAAVRISTSVGMHRRGGSFGLNPIELEQRRRVFWILYIMDKDMAIRSGRPPCINDDDCNVELPDESPSDGVGDVPLTKSNSKFNVFRALVTFAIIQSKVYMQLYSAKAVKQSDGELLNTIGELDRELEEWKGCIPAEFRPTEEAISLNEKGIVMVQVVLLHFAYYNCLTTIHRMSIHHGYWTSRLSNYAISGLSARPLNPRVFSSAALCVSASRASIHLIKYLDPKDYPCIWLVMYYPVSSLVTLFANVLQNPQDPHAAKDIVLMQKVVEFLKSVLEIDELDEGSQRYEDTTANRMLVITREFKRIAKLVLEKAEREALSKKKRKTEDATRNTNPQLDRQRQGLKRPFEQAHIPSQQANPIAPTMHSNGMRGIDISPPIFDVPQLYSQDNSIQWLNDMEQQQQQQQPSIASSNLDHQLPSFPMISANSFEQPFVPQDLWQMPMTFEWDWADVNGQMPWDGDHPPM